MSFDDDSEVPDRPVPARREAARRWRGSEPWRVRQDRRRLVKIGVVVAVVVAIGVALAVTGSSPALPPQAVVGVTSAAGGGFDLVFYGCGGERLEDVSLYAGSPPAADVTFGKGEIWFLQATGKGSTGHVVFHFGATPAGYRAVIPFAGLPANPPGDRFTLIAQTSVHLLHLTFNSGLVAGKMVVTESGRYSQASYDAAGARLCGG